MPASLLLFALNFEANEMRSFSLSLFLSLSISLPLSPLSFPPLLEMKRDAQANANEPEAELTAQLVVLNLNKEFMNFAAPS